MWKTQLYVARQIENRWEEYKKEELVDAIKQSGPEVKEQGVVIVLGNNRKVIHRGMGTVPQSNMYGRYYNGLPLQYLPLKKIRNTFIFEEETISGEFVDGGGGREGKESVNDVVTTLFVIFWIGFCSEKFLLQNKILNVIEKTRRSILGSDGLMRKS